MPAFATPMSSTRSSSVGSRSSRSPVRSLRSKSGHTGWLMARHHTEVPAATPAPGDLRRRTLGGETTFGAWVGLGSPAAGELLGRAGFDWLVVDLEHGMATETELVAHLTAIEATGAT